MLHSAIAVSDDIDFDLAVETVINECTKQIGNNTPQVGIVFTSCMDADFSMMLKKITNAFNGIELLGCTTDGEVSRDTGFIEDSVALLLLASDNVRFATSVAENISVDAGKGFAKGLAVARAKLGAEPVCAITFPDGLSTIGTALDTAIQGTFGKNFPVFGGTAGDHFLFTGTSQFWGDNVYSDAAPILILGGDVQVTSSVHIGPVPIGIHYKIDQHEKNIVYKIDGEPTIDFLKKHLGDHKEQITQFPLAVYEDGESDFYLRNTLVFNDDEGTVSFVGNFPDKCTVRLTLASRDDVCLAADRANIEIFDKVDKDPELLLLFPCTSMRHVLGTRTNDKFSILHDHPTIPYFGFYCYGEIAPLEIGQPTRFHNDTYVVVSLKSGGS